MKLKKPVCAYSLFVKDYRKIIHDKHPELPHVEIMKLISQAWKTLGQAERLKYEALAQKDKIRYNRDQELFNKEFSAMKQSMAQEEAKDKAGKGNQDPSK